MKTILALLLAATAAYAQQTITIPARTVTATVTFNGVGIPIDIAIPAETITLPVPSGGGGLPAGVTFQNGTLKVAGGISATSIALTGGPTIPFSSTGLYVLQLTGGFLEPIPYVPYVPPSK